MLVTEKLDCLIIMLLDTPNGACNTIALTMYIIIIIRFAIMSFILRLPMLSKHSGNSKHSSQQGPNSSGPGASVVRTQCQVASVSLCTLALNLLSGAGLQTTSRNWGAPCPEPCSGPARRTWLYHLSGDMSFPVPRLSSPFFLVPWLYLLSILSAGNGGDRWPKK